MKASIVHDCYGIAAGTANPSTTASDYLKLSLWIKIQPTRIQIKINIALLIHVEEK